MSNANRRREPPLPKPYEFVPLPSGGAQTTPPAGHDSYRRNAYTGTLTARIIARSPVHVASGLLEPRHDRLYPLVKAHFRTTGTLAIPGSSLKGCVRSIVEAISRSGVQVTRARELGREHQASRSPGRLDAAQRIFGALGFQGNIRVGDALLVEGGATVVPSVHLFRPRTEALATYFNGRQVRGRKFYMHGSLARGDLPLEACETGSVFQMRLHFENLTAGELGLLLIGLGLDEQHNFLPKLGGAKPACLGTIEVTGVDIVTVDVQAAYADFDDTPQQQDIAPLLQAARDERLVASEQLERLADILRWPREDRNCPDRSY